MNDSVHQYQELFKARIRGVVFVTGMIVSVTLVFQTLTLPSRNDFSVLFPAVPIPVANLRSSTTVTSEKSATVGKFSLLSDSQSSIYLSTDLKEVGIAEVVHTIGQGGRGSRMDGTTRDTVKDEDSDDDVGLEDHEHLGDRFTLDHEDGAIPRKIMDAAASLLPIDHVVNVHNTSLEMVRGLLVNDSTFLANIVNRSGVTSIFEQNEILGNEPISLPFTSSPVIPDNFPLNFTSIISSSAKNPVETVASSGEQAKGKILNNETLLPVQSDSASINAKHTSIIISSVKQTQQMLPPVSVSEMNRLLLRKHAAYHSPRHGRLSAREKDMLAAKVQIGNSRIVKNNQELYAPLFRNISMFKRSYGLMERMLKIYIYTEGKKPIFHQPLLKGIYASEGWFMKLMKTNRRFVVKDPRRAHLFYMPFSSRNLQLAMYVPNSHNMRNLKQHLKNYVDLLARKYPFWNRTGGADHFIVACHDWAPYETRDTMGRSIRALCNADLGSGFQLGKDVSVPETYVRSAGNPLRDLGGRPADGRPTLAFYAGNMHGTLRPVLVHHWENKDPNIKISGPMPAGVESKMAYIEHMKTSKYCICPRGFEVNSPRVVESIFYECVPVIISDNFVLPFFEVLNWEAFSVVLPEKDVPRLKEILESIPEEKYLALQTAVKNVQKHFLWHSTPEKFDLFHMILHNIWFNRVYGITAR